MKLAMRNMRTALGLEWYKLRRKRLFGMVLLLMLAEIAWGCTASGMSFSRHPEHAGWEPLLAMFASMNGLFMPIAAAVCVSRICDMEHKGNTWKLLLTLNAGRGALYAAKYVTASIIMTAAVLLQALAIAAFGAVNGLEQPVPLLLLLRFFAGTVLANMAVTAVQQWISLAVPNQAFALALGMIGGFFGIVADLMPRGVRAMLIWSSYTGFSPVTQTFAGETAQFAVRDMGSLLPAMAGVAAAGAVIYLAGCFHVSRREG
jgi:hypothetical protein